MARGGDYVQSELNQNETKQERCFTEAAITAQTALDCCYDISEGEWCVTAFVRIRQMRFRYKTYAHSLCNTAK